MSRVFYRYIRPIVFNEKRLDFDTQPNGGVCLRFERLSGMGGYTLFTYSRCHPEDHFNKGVAKKIADERAVAARTDERLLDAMSPSMEGVGESAEELAHFLITFCREFSPKDYPFLVGHYLSIEWKGFADALERIVSHNQRQRAIGEVWMAATAAMRTTERYVTINLGCID